MKNNPFIFVLFLACVVLSCAVNKEKPFPIESDGVIYLSAYGLKEDPALVVAEYYNIRSVKIGEVVILDTEENLEKFKKAVNWNANAAYINFKPYKLKK